MMDPMVNHSAYGHTGMPVMDAPMDIGVDPNMNFDPLDNGTMQQQPNQQGQVGAW